MHARKEGDIEVWDSEFYGMAATAIFAIIGTFAAEGGQLTAFRPVPLQASASGTAQVGHVNTTGTAKASQFQGGRG